MGTKAKPATKENEKSNENSSNVFHDLRRLKKNYSECE